MKLLQQLEHAIQRYAPEHRVPVAAFLASDPRPEAFELVESSPALGLLLAYSGHFRPDLADAWYEARQMVMHPRTDILGWLELPQSKSAVRIVNNLDVNRMSLERCKRLGGLLRLEATAKRLRHLPSICNGVIDILASRDLREIVSFALLEELCHRPDDAEIADQLICVKQLAPLHNVTIRTFRSCAAVLESAAALQLMECALVPNWLPDHGRMEFPEPPIAVPRFTQPSGIHIEPIRTPRDLYREAEEQHNCVYDSLNDIASGLAAVYRVLSPERATVMLVQNGNGDWIVSEFRAARNRSVRKDTIWAVGAYLSRRQVCGLDDDPNGHRLANDVGLSRWRRQKSHTTTLVLPGMDRNGEQAGSVGQ